MLLHQRGGLAIVSSVDDVVRVPVAAQEILDPQQVGRLPQADQHGAARPGLDQADPAQDQRAHDPLAQIRLGDDQRAQLRGRHQQRLDVFLGGRVHHRGTPRELANLGQELPAPLVRNRNDMTHAVALADRHRSFQDDQHSRVGCSGGEEALARLIAPHAAEAPDAGDFGGRQFGKHLVTPALELRRKGDRHGLAPARRTPARTRVE